MSLSLLFLLSLVPAVAQVEFKPIPIAAPGTAVSGNFPRDLYGPADTRMTGQSCNVGPCIWGHADSDQMALTFKIPNGYRAQVLRLRGDLIAWPKVMDGQPPVRSGAYAGVLMGFSTQSKESSTICDFCADGFPLYVQAGVSDQPVRVPFDYDLREDGVFLDEGKMWLKLAAFLNTTGYPIHLEGTFTITARWVKL